MANKNRKFEAALSTSANKMRIKAFPPSLNDQHVGKIWETLRRAIVEIERKNNSELSFEELYRSAYTMVLQKQGEQLYNGTKQTVTEHLTQVRDQVLESLTNGVLTHLNQCWKDHHTAMVMIRDVLMYLDRVFVAQTQRQGVYNTGLVIFRDVVVRHETIKSHLQSDLLTMVASERRGEVIPKSQLREACQMLVQLGVNGTTVYEEDFESVFLEQSREFYRQESSMLLEEMPASILYIEKVEARLEEEARRARHCLDPSTEPKIVAVLEEEFITRHLRQIVSGSEGGLPHMLANKLHSRIAAMYKLLSRVDHGLLTMSTTISAFLRQQGLAIVLDDQETPLQYVASLLLLRDKANVLLTEALDNHALFRNQINADFEYFVNDTTRSPEYLSLFIDDKLRRGTKGVDDPDMDAVLDKCIVLFRYVQDKDVFERYYKQHLAKRLLTMKSQSDDQEKSMIGKLIVECGGVFTSKLEGMFKDMAVSKTLMEDWRSSGIEDAAFDLYVRILTTGLWPTQSLNLKITLPEEAQSLFSAYSAFYLEKHNGRVINLQPNLGSVELSSIFLMNASNTAPLTMPGSSNDVGHPIQEDIYPTIAQSRDSSGSFGSQISHTGGDAATGLRAGSANSHLSITGAGASVPMVKKYILQVSTYQMVILMMFNVKHKYTFEELLRITNIPERDLTRCLLSLSMSKASQRILLKEPRGKTTDILPTDSFIVNDSFSSKHYKVKVQNITIKETEPERKETKTRVDENRKYVIEATIVRVMKARKTLTHNLLIAEVTELLKSRFLPTPQLIKQRIESLLERDYLARSEDDKKTYRYLA